jgi:hypothetical protein
MPDFGDGSPREQYGQADPFAPSVANGQISPEQWAAYEAKRRRDALFGMLGVLGMTTGLGAVGQMVGGAGGAAASGVPGAMGAAEAPLGVGSVTGGTLASTPMTSLAPYAGTVAGTGAATGGGGGIGSAIGSAMGGMSAKDWVALAAGLTGTIGGALSPKPNMTPNTMTTDPNLQRLLATMQGRMDKSEPLYDSIMSMANGLLPTQYQKGGGGMP